MSHEARPHPGGNRVLLWFALLAPPVAWASQLLAGYGISALSCGSHIGHAERWLHLLSVGMVLLTVAAIAVALFERNRLGPGNGAVSLSRARFMATAGALVGLLFLTLIVFGDVPTIFLEDYCVGHG
jgi:hypothetical protein